MKKTPENPNRPETPETNFLPNKNDSFRYRVFTCFNSFLRNPHIMREVVDNDATDNFIVNMAISAVNNFDDCLDSYLGNADMPWTFVRDNLPLQTRSNRGVPVIACVNHGTVREMIFDDGNFYLDGEIQENVYCWMAMPTGVKKI